MHNVTGLRLCVEEVSGRHLLKCVSHVKRMQCFPDHLYLFKKKKKEAMMHNSCHVREEVLHTSAELQLDWEMEIFLALFGNLLAVFHFNVSRLGVVGGVQRGDSRRREKCYQARYLCHLCKSGV